MTGGAGFIGSHIVDLLIDRGYDVCIVDNMSHGKEENINKKARFYRVDIRGKNIISIFKKEKPDYVIHEAAQICVQNSILDPINDADINILGSINVLEACREAGVKKIIYPDSAAIFGEPKYLPIDEAHPIGMISNYGVSKHTVEHYLEVYRQLYGINYNVLRYSNVYGPRQDTSGEGGVVSIFCDKLIKRQAPNIFGNGEQVRDFVYVKDVARANLMALETDKCGVFNVCTNTKTTVNQLFNYIKDIINIDIEPIYKKSRAGDIKISYMSYDKIKKQIKWEPKYRLEEGLYEMLK